jgi:adenylate kinase family enzyme
VVERISIVGTSGSGKTTLARQLVERLDLPHLELDAVFHQPGWTPLPDDEFTARVRDFCAGDRWVICGKYQQVRPIVFGRADTIVCLDHNRLRQTLRVAWRTVRRWGRREELWNGNRESLRNLWVFQPGDGSIVRWTWDNVPSARRLFDEVEAESAPRGVDVVRLRGWPEIEGWLQAATGGFADPSGRGRQLSRRRRCGGRRRGPGG